MLTRLEVDGFKNLKRFSVDFGPYTCIVGQNAVGKSNIFDAISFLGATTEGTLNDAAANLRGLRGDISEIFGNEDKTIDFAAELIVAPSFQDDFGQVVTAETTYLRYELEIALVEHAFAPGQNVRTIELIREELRPLTKKHAKEKLKWAKEEFLNTAIKIKGTRKASIETTADEYIEARSGKAGRAPKIPLNEVGSTVLSVYGRNSEYSAISAAHQELSTWKLLGLEPSAMRAPSAMNDPSSIDERGSHLPATLARLTQELGSEATTSLEDTMLDLVDVRGVSLDIDSSRQLITLSAQIGNSPMLPARALSDGTLRFITLGLLAIDPKAHDVLCFEEPENGIYPDKLDAMYRLLHELAVDPSREVSEDNPLQQMIVNSHSPAYLALHRNTWGELLVAHSHPHDGSLRLLPVSDKNNWRTKNPRTPAVIPEAINEILEVSAHSPYEVA
ncbi:AAA family ATPase [Corynebacterium sp.]|uniref:AAA family ATPase n=1 Tax=Corynebacterium sp. TaxID=1720 RepID=UPI0026DDAD9B|nr:AAA family ATPase [Corynebacterium sp.]MDO5032879.1 AAA family ATPase [Corynebacterium sp.]